MVRSGRRARAALALFVLLATVASPATVGAGSGTAGPKPSEVTQAIAFRSKLGLRSDRTYVAATFGQRGFSIARWGVPLDTAEAAELGRRVKAEKALGRALRAWAKESEAAGAYVDQRAGGVAVFLTTGDPGRAKRDLAAVLPRGLGAGGVQFVRVAHSMAELLDLQSLINADLRAGLLRDLGVVSTSIDARANAVRIGVAGTSPAIGSELASRYGDAVTVAFEPPAQGGDAEPCTSRKECPPAKSGIEIRSSYNGNSCTTGFMVRVVGSPEPRVLTAGHCIGMSGGTGTSRVWSHDGRPLAWAELTSWANGADADVGVLTPADGAVDGDRNLLFRASTADVVPISGWRPTAEQVQGGLVCRAGAVSNYHCGTITLTNRTRAVDGRTIDHQWVVDFDACPGDSGGPYLLDDVAYGLHSDSSWGCDPSRNQAWYSPMGWVFTVLAAKGHPVELCTTATCGSDTNVWTTRGSLDVAVVDPRLVALEDDRVLQVGGLASDPLGAAAAGSAIPAPAAFDPASGEWAQVATPPWAPADCEGQFAVRLVDGRVLVGGGRRSDPGDADACLGASLFDPEDGPDGSWDAAAAPPVQLLSAGAVLLDDGRAFVTGGSGATGSESIALAYDPDADEWSTLTPAPAGALAPLVLRLPSERVLVSGGYVVADPATGGLVHVAATHLYDPVSDAWTSTGAVGAYGRAGTVLRDGRVVLAGGQHLSWNGSQQGTFLNTVSLFTPSSGTWSSLTGLPTGRAGLTLAELANGLLLAAGGRVADNASPTGVSSRSAHAYDWGPKVWRTAPSLVEARAGQGSTLLGDGRVLVVGGETASTETYVAGDVLPPSATTPSSALRKGAQMASASIPVRFAWTATDWGGSGVGTYDVARSTDGGPFQTIATRVTQPSFGSAVSPGHTYRYQVRPRDWAGNLGPWKAGSALAVKLYQESSGLATYTGTWKPLSGLQYTGGKSRYTKAAGASVTFRFSGRGVSWISKRGPTLGAARVYIDGTYAGTINLYLSTWQDRYVAFERTWSGSGSHRIRIVNVGTYGHPRIDVDGFIVLTKP